MLQVVETEIALVVDIRNNKLTQELRHVQLKPAILESQLRSAAMGLAKDEELLGNTNMLTRQTAGSSNGTSKGANTATSLTGGLTATLSAVASAYEESGGLWGLVHKATSGGKSRSLSSAPRLPATQQYEHQASVASARAPALPSTEVETETMIGQDEIVGTTPQAGSRTKSTKQNGVEPKGKSNTNYEDLFDF